MDAESWNIIHDLKAGFLNSGHHLRANNHPLISGPPALNDALVEQENQVSLLSCVTLLLYTHVRLLPPKLQQQFDVGIICSVLQMPAKRLLDSLLT